MDDRILLIPAPFAPDPVVFEKWPALRTLMQRLRAFLPLDILLWPLKGEARRDSALEDMAEAIRQQVSAFHHVLDISHFPEFLFWALGDPPIRSHVVAGFTPSPAIAQGAGDPLLITALEVARGFANRAQVVPQVMQGAAGEDLASISSEVERTFDAGFARRVNDELQAMAAARISPSRAPTLYLSSALRIPGDERLFEIFRRYVPNAEHGGQLSEWPIRLHEEAPGHELADKAIPFIERVIAQRQNDED